MKKKNKILLSIILTLLLILIVISGISRLAKLSYESDAKIREECRKEGFECPGTMVVHRYRECSDSCKGIDMAYYKLDVSGFGSDECWCKKDNEIKQVY